MRRIRAVLILLVAMGSVAAQDRTIASRSDAKLREADENYRRGMQAADGVGGRKDYMTAALYYRKAAESGYVAAQYNLAYLYENGLGVKQDFAQAAASYRKAADQGDPESQNNPGFCIAPARACPTMTQKPHVCIVWLPPRTIWKARRTWPLCTFKGAV